MTQSSWNAEYNSAKGSILIGNNIRPIVRTVGIDGQVFTADSAQADGVSWSSIVNIQAAVLYIIAEFAINTTQAAIQGVRSNNTNLATSMDAAATLRVNGFYLI